MEMQKETQKKAANTSTSQPSATQKAVTVSPSKTITPSEAETNTAWGTEEAGAEDIIIPKLLLMHGLSQLVMKGDKQQGMLVRSTDAAVLAEKGKSVRVIPFFMFKSWRISEMVGKKYEWRGNVPFKAGEQDLPWEYTEDGKSMRRDFAYNFYTMVAGDTEGFPLLMQFTRTSKKAGKMLADHFAKCKMRQRPPAIQTFEIGSEFVQAKENQFYVFTAKPSSATTPEELHACKEWFDLIKSAGSRIKEDETSDVVQAEETQTKTTEEF